MSKPRSSALRVECPHCCSHAFIRTSKTLTPLYRELHYQCSNAMCGHTFVAAIDIIRTICPSQMPNPEINLPILRGEMPRRQIAANDPVLPANDAGTATEPIPEPSTG